MTTSHFHWRPHPWHGLEPGPDCPEVVTAYIEITPFDLVKYEVDKETGYLRVDRPLLFGFWALRRGALLHSRPRFLSV